jgi:hypothetical protein
MKIRCECGAIYNVSESTCGKNVQCKKCDTTFVCPTPPPKLSLNPSGQNVPGTFVRSPYAKSSLASQPATVQQQQEEAILKKFMSEEKSLEDRMRERREGSIEEDRVSNSVNFIIIGVLWMAAGIGIGVIFYWLATFSRIPILAWVLFGIGAQYWLPPLFIVFGIYKIMIGVMSLFRVVDIESEEQLPSNW